MTGCNSAHTNWYEKKNENIRTNIFRTALKSNIMALSTALSKYHVCERE